MSRKSEQIGASVAARADWLTGLSDRIWEHPELCFDEFVSSGILMDALKKEGFAVTEHLAGLPTAFSGRWGSGKPCIGILGEYDALSGMSQAADALEPKPLVPGGPGHGCGHNLLGVGSLAAVIAVKDYMQANGLPGTILYYGCPAEEGGSGKAILAREHIFDELDVALTWHPGNITAAPAHSSLANVGVVYRFHGVSAHAAGAPHRGRSALDALTLMNTGVQFLREHVPEKTRIHYAVLDAGGTAPNVVQASSAAYYLIRHPKLDELKAICSRVDDVARGAALMTGTTVDITYVKGCANIIPNKALSKLLTKNMQEAVQPDYTPEDKQYAAAFADTVPGPDSMIEQAMRYGAAYPKLMEMARAHDGEPIHSLVIPLLPQVITPSSSTDVGDVSWMCPCGQAQVTTMSAKTGSHTWQRTAQGKSAVAHKGMLFAGRILAGAAVDLLEDPALVAEARAEWQERLDGKVYSPMAGTMNPEIVKQLLFAEP